MERTMTRPTSRIEVRSAFSSMVWGMTLKPAIKMGAMTKTVAIPPIIGHVSVLEKRGVKLLALPQKIPAMIKIRERMIKP